MESVGLLLTVAVHWLHVIFAIAWFGSIIYNNLVVWPDLERHAPGVRDQVRAAGRLGRGRNTTLVMSAGTVGLGIVRGAMGGVFGQLDTAYGLTYLAALVIGLAMTVSVNGKWFHNRAMDKAYLAGFPVMFTLMVAMRFGY